MNLQQLLQLLPDNVPIEFLARIVLWALIAIALVLVIWILA